MQVAKIQLRADSDRSEDMKVFLKLKEVGAYGVYDEDAMVGKTAFIVVSKSPWDGSPAALSETQIGELRTLSAVEDVIFAEKETEIWGRYGRKSIR